MVSEKVAENVCSDHYQTSKIVCFPTTFIGDPVHEMGIAGSLLLSRIHSGLVGGWLGILGSNFVFVFLPSGTFLHV